MEDYLQAKFVRALSLNDVEKVQKYINNGFDVNVVLSGFKMTPLLKAAVVCTEVKIFRKLVKAGADINQRDKTGYQALARAAGKPHRVAVIQELVRLGANINDINLKHHGYTALTEAASTGCVDNFRALIELGADYKHTNILHQTAVDIARVDQGPMVADELQKVIDNSPAEIQQRTMRAMRRPIRQPKVEEVAPVIKICDNCDENTARESCHECSQKLCSMCSSVIHKPPAMRGHKREPLNQEIAAVKSPMHAVPTQAPISADQATPHQSLPKSPLFLNRYKFHGEHQQGAMHVVRTAKDKQGNHEVALKFIDNLDVFLHEVDMLTTLRNDFVVDIIKKHKSIDLREVRQEFELPEFQHPVHIIVLKKLNKTLADCILKMDDKYRASEGRTIALKLAHALSFIHSRKIAHCDLKPRNVMSDDNNLWKLIDLDNARHFGQLISARTTFYCAPEAFEPGCKASAALDVWSFGLILWELYTGRSPYFGMSEEEIEEKLKKKEFEFPFQVIHDNHLRDLLRDKMLVYDPQMRWPMHKIENNAYFVGGLNTREVKSAKKELGDQLSRIADSTEATRKNTDSIKHDTKKVKKEVLGLQEKTTAIQHDATAIKGTTEAIHKDTEEIHADTRAIKSDTTAIKHDVESILQKVSALKIQLHDVSEFPVPRLFIILPETPDKRWSWKPTDWGKHKFKLYLLCEEETGIHCDADHKGYEIKDPKKFVQKLGPIAAVGLKILNFALQLGQSTLPISASIPGEFISYMETVGDRPTEGMENLTGTIDRVHGAKAKGDLDGEAHQAFGKTIRELKAFLDSHDTSGWGNLQRMTMNDGHVRWLCKDHAKKHETANEKDTTINFKMPANAPAKPPVTLPLSMKLAKKTP